MKRLLLLLTIAVFCTQNSFSQKTFSGFGASVGTNILIGETKITDSALSPNIGFHGIFDFSDNISLKLQTGYGQFGIDNSNSILLTSFIPVEIIGMIRPFGKSNISPFFHLGLGAISFSQNGSRYYDGLFIGGGGISALMSERLSFLVSTDLRYTTSDQFNGITKGFYDGYLNFQIGLTYNLNPQKTYERKSKLRRTDIIAANEKSSDPILELVEMRSQINLLKKEISVRDEQIRQIMSQLQTRRDRIAKIESQIAGLSKGAGRSEKPTATQSVTVQNSLKNTPLSNAEIIKRYQQTQTLIRLRQFDRAVFELEMLSQNAGNHPLQSNFIYWIGECYFAQGKYSKAVNSFEKVGNFKNSYKLDDALIMSGISFMKLGNLKNASQKFRELIQKFPDSEYVDRATKYLQAAERQIIS